MAGGEIMTIQSKTIRWSRAVILAFVFGGFSLGDGRPQAPAADGISRLMTAAGVPWRIRTSLSESVPPATCLGGALGWGENALDRGGTYDLCGLAVRPLDGQADPAVIYRPEGMLRHWKARNRVVFPPMRAGDIEVSREVDVLEDSEICRWFDSFTNLADEPRTFEVVLYHGLGGGDRPLMAVSNVDGSIGSVADDGIVLVPTGSESRGNGAAGVLGHIVQGADSRALLLRADFGARGPIYEPGLGSVAAAWVYRMTLAPGQRGIILNALAAGSNPDAVRAELRRYLDGRLLILNGLTREERGNIVNFNAALATTAWPQVKILSPSDVASLSITTFPVRIHAADADKIVRLEVQACSEVGRDEWRCQPTYTSLAQGASLDYEFSRSHCDFIDSEVELMLSAQVWNAAGQTAYDSVMFWMWPPHDLRARFASPSDGARRGGLIPVTVEVRSEISADLEILVDGVVKSTYEIASDGNQIWRPVNWIWDASGVAAGRHRLDARISDHEGQVETACGISVDVFNGIPPTVSIGPPAAGAVVHGFVGIAAQARDEDRVVRLDLFVDGIALAAVQGSSISLSAEAVWASADAANGMHEIKAVARDNDGLEGTSVLQVDVRNILLSIAVSPGVDKSGSKSRPYAAVQLTIDNSPGLQAALYVLLRSNNGGPFQGIKGVPAWKMGGETYGFVDYAIQQGHAYSYRVEAYDASGAKIGRSLEVGL